MAYLSNKRKHDVCVAVRAMVAEGWRYTGIADGALQFEREVAGGTQRTEVRVCKRERK